MTAPAPAAQAPNAGATKSGLQTMLVRVSGTAVCDGTARSSYDVYLTTVCGSPSAWRPPPVQGGVDYACPPHSSCVCAQETCVDCTGASGSTCDEEMHCAGTGCWDSCPAAGSRCTLEPAVHPLTGESGLHVIIDAPSPGEAWVLPGAGTYSYGDVTGFAVRNVSSPQGMWTVGQFCSADEPMSMVVDHVIETPALGGLVLVVPPSWPELTDVAVASNGMLVGWNVPATAVANQLERERLRFDWQQVGGPQAQLSLAGAPIAVVPPQGTYRFDWDRLGEGNAWIRVVQPTRGSVWLPTVNDEVIVDFQFGEADRPVVIGKLWNASQAARGALTPASTIESVVLRVGAMSTPSQSEGGLSGFQLFDVRVESLSPGSTPDTHDVVLSFQSADVVASRSAEQAATTRVDTLSEQPAAAAGPRVSEHFIEWLRTSWDRPAGSVVRRLVSAELAGNHRRIRLMAGDIGIEPSELEHIVEQQAVWCALENVRLSTEGLLGLEPAALATGTPHTGDAVEAQTHRALEAAGIASDRSRRKLAKQVTAGLIDPVTAAGTRKFAELASPWSAPKVPGRWKTPTLPVRRGLAHELNWTWEFARNVRAGTAPPVPPPPAPPLTDSQRDAFHHRMREWQRRFQEQNGRPPTEQEEKQAADRIDGEVRKDVQSTPYDNP